MPSLNVLKSCTTFSTSSSTNCSNGSTMRPFRRRANWIRARRVGRPSCSGQSGIVRLTSSSGARCSRMVVKISLALVQKWRDASGFCGWSAKSAPRQRLSRSSDNAKKFPFDARLTQASKVVGLSRVGRFVREEGVQHLDAVRALPVRTGRGGRSQAGWSVVRLRRTRGSHTSDATSRRRPEVTRVS